MLTSYFSHQNKDVEQSLPVWISFLLILLSCYGNSFNADWHFDDVQNILLNEPIHLSDLNGNSLKKTFFAYPGQPGTLLRPVSNLSFALNWFFGADNVFGYHLVNFIIHFFSTLFLYQSCLLLLSTPRLADKYQDSKFFIATLAAALWAINPIQTQAVTYIVQRAASLSALFSIVGIWCHLKARLTSSRKHIFFYFGVTASFLLAVGSKENAVLLPLSLLLIEIIFFPKKYGIKNILPFFFAIGLILFFTILIVGNNFFVNILDSYQDRSFSLWQRILTQPRIIIFYISLLLYPSPMRLSIDHDVPLPDSIFSQPMTIISIAFLSIIFIYSLLLRKKKPLFSFAILFFLINHSVESSILNLELIFEHRNYLPSFFFFLPMADVISTAVEKYRSKNRATYLAICAGTVSWVIFLALATILRNMAWRTDADLWADALTKAPLSSRPHINLAYNLKYDGNYQRAFDLYQRSLDKFSSTPWKDRFKAYAGMGEIMMQIGKPGNAAPFFDKAAEFAREKSKNMYREAIFLKSKALWLNHEYEIALNQILKIIDRDVDLSHAQFYAEMLIFFKKNDEAFAVLQHIVKKVDLQNFGYKMALLDFGLLHSKIGIHDKAYFYIQLARKLNAPDIPSLLCLLEHSLLADNPAQAEQTFLQLLDRLTWNDFIDMLEKFPHDFFALPVSSDLIRQYALDWLASQEKRS